MSSRSGAATTESALTDSGFGQGLKTLVLLCQRLSTLGNGLDLAEIGRWLEDADPAVAVRVVADPCKGSRDVSGPDGSVTERLVLGVCSDGYADSHHEAARLREVGLDPLGVERVNLGGHCALAHPRDQATTKAKILLAAAVSRARAFRGSRPDNVRPHLVRRQQKVSRRALFTLPPIRYQPVASIDQEQCVAQEGCRLCADVCPCDALSKVNGRIALEKSRCQACGICVAECPREAIELPTASLPQIEAEMRTLLATSARESFPSVGVLFVCQRNAAILEELAKKGFSYPAGWLPLQVPCAGMVSTSWLLGCLAWGAQAVGVLACNGECSFGQHERIEGKVAYCRELLRLLGGSTEEVKLLHPSPLDALTDALELALETSARRRERRPAGLSLSGPQSAAQAILTLADERASPVALSLVHSHSPLGMVRVDAGGCTGCGACAKACPTDALAFREEDGAVSLTFDPSRCVGCDQCRPWCPEHLIQTEKVTDLRRLAEGKTTLYEDREVRCEHCGSVIGPAAMLRRLEVLLTDDSDTNAATLAAITRRCPSCRVAAGASIV